MANQLEVWKNRWESLSGTMDALIDIYDQENFSRKTTLCCLLKCLKAFGEKHFNYFYQTFTQPANKSKEYPPEYACYVSLDQIAYDLEVIQRAAEQRILGSKAMKTALKIADEFAWQALQPALGADRLLKDPKMTVITYFHKSANIHVIPYAPVALVGIPITCAPVFHTSLGTSPTDVPVVAQDYLAIPHEVGHYVYWHGKAKVDGEERYILDALYRKMLQLEDPPLWFFRWVEEIFADVYGCLFAGPLIALDFQGLQLTFSKKRFLMDDGEHPAPVLRPYIYTRVLEKLEEDGWLPQSWSGNLEVRWNGKRAERRAEWGIDSDAFALDEPEMPGGVVSSIVSFFWKYASSKFQPDDARTQVNGIVDAIYDVLSDNITVLDWWKAEKFSELQPPEIEGLESLLYGKFESYLREEFKQHFIDPESSPEFSPDWETCVDLERCIDWDDWEDTVPEMPGARLKKLREELQAKILDIEPEPEWVNVLDAEGWSTKGPSSADH